jgi:hypothetical protein
MNKTDSLIFELIFSEKSDFRINISDYIDEPYKYDRFVDELKSILKKSKVTVVREKVNLDTEGAIWILKVKK